MVVELPDSGGQIDQAVEEEPPCWHHLGCKGELADEQEQFPLGGLVLENTKTWLALSAPPACQGVGN